MSDPVSALGGETTQGFATVRDEGARGMVSLRGEDLAKLAKAVGMSAPEPLSVTTKDGLSLFWMSPDELLLTCDYDAAPAMAAAAEEALGTAHHLVAVVSDARVVVSVTGEKADEVLRKVTPANMDALEPGMIRRTRLAQIAGAIHMIEDGHYEVYAFRSTARYLMDLLTQSAKPGAELGL